MKLIKWLALAMLIGALPSAGQGQSGGRPALQLERVVLLMRHGIRPPTKAAVTPPGMAADPWPTWSTPFGELTQHGYRAIELLGAFDRLSWSRAGLFAASGCPAAGEVVVATDVEERTTRTGEAMIAGLFPGCGIVNRRLSAQEAGALFNPLDRPGSLDNAAAGSAIVARFGDVSQVQNAHRADFDRFQAVLGCCSRAACAQAGQASPCRIADMNSHIVLGGEGRPRLSGPLEFASTAAEVLMLEYVEGLPVDQVAWGRADAAGVEAIMRLHAVKTDILQRTPYLGRRGAANLMRRMLQAAEGSGPEGANGSKLTVLVGHDTNIGDLSGLLGFDWHVPSFPPNDAAPGGGVGLEVLRDAAGVRYARAFYQSQTMDQMRNLTPLTWADPLFRQYLAIPGCRLGADATICALAQFEQVVRAQLPPATEARHTDPIQPSRGTST